MEELSIKSHTELCISSSKRMSESENDFFVGNSNYCERNPNYLLFSVFNKFIVVEYHQCFSEYREIDFKKQIIELFLSKEKYTLYDVEKSINLETLFKEKEIIDSNTNFIQQINFVYHDNAKKYYAITTTTKKSFDTIFNKQEFEKNYIEAKEILSKHKQPFLLNEIDFLYKKIIDFNNI